MRDLEAVNTKLATRLDVMTPRPVWRKLADHSLAVGREGGGGRGLELQQAQEGPPRG